VSGSAGRLSEFPQQKLARSNIRARPVVRCPTRIHSLNRALAFCELRQILNLTRKRDETALTTRLAMNQPIMRMITSHSRNRSK